MIAPKSKPSPWQYADWNLKMLNPKLIGALCGLVVGLVVILLGILKAFILALFILAGWFIGKLWMREIDLLAMYQRFKNNRAEKRREKF